MAGLRVEMLLVFLTGTLLLSGALGWERIQEKQLQDFYATGLKGEENAGDDSDYDDYEDEDSEVEDATTANIDPHVDHGVLPDTDSGPSDWSSIDEDEFQTETDSNPSDWSSIKEDDFHVETVVGPRDWSSVTNDAFQVEMGSGPEDWSSGPDDGFQVETESGRGDWSSDPDDDDFQVETASGPGDWFSGPDDDDFQVETAAGPSDWSGKDEFQVETASGPEDWSSDPDDDFQGEKDSGPSDLTGEPDDFPEEEDSGPRGWAGTTDDGSSMEFIDSPPTHWPAITRPESTGLDVVCSEAGFHISLSAGSLRGVKVLGSKGAPKNCSYKVKPNQRSLTVPFSGCNVKQQAAGYSLRLLYNNHHGLAQVVQMFCEINSGLVPRLSPTIPPKCPTTQPTKPKNCNIPREERLPCGYKGISAALCKKKGCCSASSACFYPLDECTADKYMIFAIRYNSASIPLDPKKLVVPGHPKCKPVLVNSKVAIYRFKVAECGVRTYVVGKTRVYLAEVQTVIQALNLKYGVITRNDPLRFLIECRYGQSGPTQGAALSSVGYMVKIPTSTDSIWPSSISSRGLYSVQLRLTTDKSYSRYLPTYHPPLHLMLGKPLYLELNLKSPKPDAVLLVNYCLAYPRSAKNALVLIYQGCPNPFDKSVAILYVRDPPNNRHKRRFMVKVFQFMDVKKKSFLNEEIYFMCSTEVCRTLEKKCRQRCFDKS